MVTIRQLSRTKALKVADKGKLKAAPSKKAKAQGLKTSRNQEEIPG